MSCMCFHNVAYKFKITYLLNFLQIFSIDQISTFEPTYKEWLKMHLCTQNVPCAGWSRNGMTQVNIQ